jgi:D-alanine-D-alanine ligase-like ATP-grasp enzyme
MRRAFMPEILARIAPSVGAEVIAEPEYGFAGMLRFDNGRTSFFWENKFDLNPIASVKVAQDKGYAAHFLRAQGFSVPAQQTFFREGFRRTIRSPRGLDEARRFAESLGWPVYLKPCRRSQGEFVADVWNDAELIEHATALFEVERAMIVQAACPGNDYRFVVLDDEVISAYRRVHMQVVGDGRATVRELLDARQRGFVETGRDTIIPMHDARIVRALRREGMTFESVPEPHRAVTLMGVANLSLGGGCEDVTAVAHPSVIELAVRITRAMGLRFCGVDVVMRDAREPLGDYQVLEINSSPGLDNYQHDDAAVQRAYTDGLYRKVLLAVRGG